MLTTGRSREVRLWPLKRLATASTSTVIGGPRVETTRFSEGQDPLHPAVALGTGRPQRALPPEDAKAQGALGAIVGRLHAVLGQKHPERVHLAQQAAGKPSGLIGAVMILVNPLAEPGIPRPPLPARGWGGGHMAEPLQLGQRPSSTGRQLGMPGSPSLGPCGSGGPGRSGGGDPVLVHAIAITDQEAGPVVDQGGKGLFGAAGMNHVEAPPCH